MQPLWRGKAERVGNPSVRGLCLYGGVRDCAWPKKSATVGEPGLAFG
jgi:hypothetical protein